MQQIYEREGHSRRASVRACWGGLFVFAERVQVEPCGCSDGVLAAGLSFGSLKYKHHFGLDCFSMRGEQ